MKTNEKITISARVRDGGRWGDCEFVARSMQNGMRTAARKLGLRGPILTCRQMGASQYEINVNGCTMMLIISVS